MPDITCKEAALSEQFYDFLLSAEYLQQYGYDAGYCVQRLEPTSGCIFLPASSQPPLTVYNTSYASIPKLYGLMDGIATDLSRVIELQTKDYLGLDGSGVLIGIVGTGIRYESSYFRRSDGSTRIVGIWDQTVQTGIPPEGIVFGSAYTEADINAALASDTPLSIVPSEDTNGYGTYLASAACASANVTTSFRGVAPASSIAVVKLKEAKSYLKNFYAVPQNATAYQENDIMLAIKYLCDLANMLSMPLCICLCTGSSMGSHSGTSFLSQYINYNSIGTKCIVCGTGNEAGARHHFYGQFSPEEDYIDIEVRVSENSTGFWMEIWGNAPDIYTIGVLSPSGEMLQRIPYSQGGGMDYRFTFEGSTLSVSYQTVGEVIGNSLIILRMQRPANGIWTFRIYGSSLLYGTFHMWLPISGFLEGDTYFLASNPDMTLTDPSSSSRAITVSAYDSFNNSILLESGRGYTLSQRIKPYVATPGVAVPGITLRDTITRRSGTSGSAALTAGACALIFQWTYALGNEPDFNTLQLSTQLIRGASRSNGRTYPNRAWGYGALNLERTFENFRPI